MRTTVNQTKHMTLTALFAVLIAVCAWISIPTVIPFTMQTFGVFLTLAVLGGKHGTIAICVYLLLGFIGIPVYAGGTSGAGVLFGNTGGYMIAWIFTGLIVWGIETWIGKKTWCLALGMILGLLVCYTFGTVWFIVLYAKNLGQIGLWTALLWCVIPFIIPDLVKLALALTVYKRLRPLIY